MDVSTALYRRYRPETFDEVIGQEHVTDPLKAAIERGRINHAYLFSGPRGCGKTTSARILARCLNCVQGPTPVPCGECPSCQDLANGGPGSLDVVEIDAASHNGVDDARDLRERAIYAPARDRYKVFILDEAHMVTSQGFNALLKIVEEPPPHIKFIFATTEPEKVIGTIRSRTHHYPFRLVPPEALGNYMDDLCSREGVQVAKGVLPLVVRAGGGSVRDTLSVLDQLIAGSGPDGVDYAGAIALLGYTPDSLLSDIVDAFSAGDGGGVYRAVERVIESGQDPRRFVEDLLERMRDLIVINAAPEAAHAFLPEVPPDRLERLTLQARGFGQGELSRSADLLNQGLTEMSGATSPRLQLELICARILLPGSGRSRDAVLSRVERMERRIGMSASGTAANIPPAQQDGAVHPGGSAQPGGVTQSSGSTQQGGGQGGAAQTDSASPTQERTQPAQAPVTQTSSAAPRDDFDDLAEMAVAAESMLNEPPRSAPANRSQEDSSQSAVTPQSASAAAGEQTPGRGVQDTGPTAPSGAAPREQRVSEPEPQEQTVRTPDNRTRDAQPPEQQAPGAQTPSPQTAAPQVHDGEPANAPSQETASEADYAPEGDAVAGAGNIGGEIEAIRRAWPSILAAVEKRSRLTRAIIAANAIPQSFSDGVVYLGFNNAGSVQGFQQRDHAAKLAMAINDVLGIQARIDIGDVGRIGGNSGGNSGSASGGKGASAPVMNDSTGSRGPAPSQRRPSPQEVAAVVGTREVDKPQVDHEKFWEPSGSPQGPWSDDDEEGEQPAVHETPQQPTEPEPSYDASRDADDSPNTQTEPASDPASRGQFAPNAQSVSDRVPAPDLAPVSADHSHVAEESAVSEAPAVDAPASPAPVVEDGAADADIVVPDLSDDDFFSEPSTAASDQQSDNDPLPDIGPQAGHATQAVSDAPGPPDGPGPRDAPGAPDAPTEYVQPRWEEPTWHDAPSDAAPTHSDPSGAETEPSDPNDESTSAGSGAVEVGALVVPPPEDDDLDVLGDYADADLGMPASAAQPPPPSQPQAPSLQSARPQGNGGAKPFKSRFAALAEKHGGSTPQPPAETAENGYPPNADASVSGTGAIDADADGQAPNAGTDEDEYDPETDLDVSEAPQVGVAVIARVLGGEIIDEREV
ncbi:DNA polymerase-3 subunit gamma/tau [Brevibacterium sandarakinum]|uniref:DNA-directed DNA polymerase n=1 Tax=Brevibacterium sandarakinum TaxID=629680 RepID=A0A1H1N0I4_BRESA|nr:DNA polymerase-3 subunit gamma/tau [Brevibacterium sandarakinum]